MHKLIIYILLLSFLSTFGNAQESIDSYKKISIGLSIEPTYGYRTLNFSDVNELVAEIRNENEIPKFGINVGLNVKYELSKSLHIESGLIYMNTGVKTKIQTYESPTMTELMVSESQTTFTYSSIGFPLKLNYFITNGKLKTYLMGGASLNLFLNQKTTVKSRYFNDTFSDHSNVTDLGFSNSTYSLMVGFGITYPINSRFVLNLEPNYSRYITSISPNASASEYFYTFGLNTKVYYRFIK